MEQIQVLGASALVAGIPALIGLAMLWWLDRYEKEPLGLLLVALLWGAVPTIVLSIISQTILEIPLVALVGDNELLHGLIDSALLAPITEEGFKAILLIVMYQFFRHELNGPMDGVLYGAAVGFGFSVVEDVLYLSTAHDQGGWESWGQLALLRVGLFTFNHSLFTACTGMGLGLARISRHPLARMAAALGGFLLAIALHGIHNAGAVLSDSTDGMSFVLAWFVDWLGVLMLFALGLVFVQREKRRLVELKEEVASGLLSPAEFEQATRYRTRFATGLRLFFTAGPFAWWRWYRFVQAVVVLAFRKHSARHLEDAAAEVSLASQRERIRALRPA